MLSQSNLRRPNPKAGPAPRRQRKLKRMSRTIPLAALAGSLAASLVLAGCGKPDDSGAKPAPADTPSNFGQPLDARGYDPVWGLTIRGTTLTLTRPGTAPVVATAPG